MIRQSIPPLVLLQVGSAFGALAPHLGQNAPNTGGIALREILGLWRGGGCRIDIMVLRSMGVMNGTRYRKVAAVAGLGLINICAGLLSLPRHDQLRLARPGLARTVHARATDDANALCGRARSDAARDPAGGNALPGAHRGAGNTCPGGGRRHEGTVISDAVCLAAGRHAAGAGGRSAHGAAGRLQPGGGFAGLALELAGEAHGCGGSGKTTCGDFIVIDTGVRGI
jgi:hypothetical protein